MRGCDRGRSRVTLSTDFPECFLDLPWLDFWRFRAAQPVAALLDGQYHISLVVLSFSVAILAAFAAWAVVDRIAASRSRGTRWLWLWAGAGVLGTGSGRCTSSACWPSRSPPR